MLNVYTRHYPPCTQTDVHYRRCRCPKWINGTLPNGQFIRISARTRSWEMAEKKSRSIEARDGDCPAQEKPVVVTSVPSLPEPGSEPVTIQHAVELFLKDEEARKLAKTSTGQSKTLFKKQLLPWMKKQRLVYLEQVTTPVLREFRASLKNNDLTTQRKHHRLNSFFDFCIENEWIFKNPSKKMKGVQVSQKPTGYFTPEEFCKITDATYAYGNWRGGRDFKNRAVRLRALILLMRWSGLSILDAIKLERSRLNRERLFLYRQKTKVPVYVPLPPYVSELLRALPNSNPNYFFWSGRGDPNSAKKGWQRSLRTLFAKLDFKDENGDRKRCHSHMFRNTFAVELLLAGAPLDQVSILLGHSSIKVTERHYSPFVKARQQQLEATARLAWQPAVDQEPPRQAVM